MLRREGDTQGSDMVTWAQNVSNSGLPLRKLNAVQGQTPERANKGAGNVKPSRNYSRAGGNGGVQGTGQRKALKR